MSTRDTAIMTIIKRIDDLASQATEPHQAEVILLLSEAYAWLHSPAQGHSRRRGDSPVGG